MGLRISTNIASMSAQRRLGDITSQLEGVYARLASGLRISSAADDPAGLGISERMRAQIRSYASAIRDAQDGMSLAQTAEGALGEVSSLLGRMRELAVQSSNGTLSSTDRASLSTEFSALSDEIDRIASTTEFNGVGLLDGSHTISIMTGIHTGQLTDIDTSDTSTSALGLATLSIASASGAQAALASLDDAVDEIALVRGRFGVSSTLLASRIRSLSIARESLSAAESRIRDADMAFEAAQLARLTVLQQAATAVLAQANQQPALALQLLGLR